MILDERVSFTHLDHTDEPLVSGPADVAERDKERIIEAEEAWWARVVPLFPTGAPERSPRLLWALQLQRSWELLTQLVGSEYEEATLNCHPVFADLLLETECIMRALLGRLDGEPEREVQ